MDTPTPYRGTPIFMGGQNYVIPSLSVRQYRQFEATLAGLAGVAADKASEHFTAMLPVIQAALSRNYPDITVEKLEELLDLSTFPLAIKAVCGNSGLKDAQPGE